MLCSKDEVFCNTEWRETISTPCCCESTSCPLVTIACLPTCSTKASARKEKLKNFLAEFQQGGRQECCAFHSSLKDCVNLQSLNLKPCCKTWSDSASDVAKHRIMLQSIVIHCAIFGLVLIAASCCKEWVDATHLGTHLGPCGASPCQLKLHLSNERHAHAAVMNIIMYHIALQHTLRFAALLVLCSTLCFSAHPPCSTSVLLLCSSLCASGEHFMFVVWYDNILQATCPYCLCQEHKNYFLCIMYCGTPSKHAKDPWTA